MMLTQSEIKELLPHREPLLLLDSVSECNAASITAFLTIRPDWSIFQGHFPGNPIFPGIYITESMTQAAALMLLCSPENKDKVPLLFQIQQMRFLRSVYPNDILEVKAVLKTSPGNELFDCLVSAFVEGQKIASGSITLALR